MSPFLAPTAETRAYFDSQSSAIHITPNPNGRYDINEIKEDTLWLSKEVGIEEIAALRIAILEYQARPATWLLQDCADRDAPGMDISAGGKSANPFLRNSNFNAGFSLIRPSEDAFSSVQTRRLRLLEVYLSERQYLSICADFVIFRALHLGPFREKDVDSWGIRLSPNESSWLGDAGVQITNQWKLSQVASSSKKHWVIEAIAALELRIRNIGESSGWLQEEDTAIDVEPDWCQMQLTDILHILYMILNFTLSDPTLTRSDVFQTWFEFMADHGFFEQFELVSRFFLMAIHNEMLIKIRSRSPTCMLSIRFQSNVFSRSCRLLCSSFHWHLSLYRISLHQYWLWIQLMIRRIFSTNLSLNLPTRF